MRGHALVQLVVIALVAPATNVDGEAPASTVAALPTAEPSVDVAGVDVAFLPGQQLVRRGEYAEAAQFYADVASQNAALAPRALLLQARATLADGDPDTAEALVQQSLADHPNSDQTANAYFALEQIRRSAGNCSGAL